MASSSATSSKVGSRQLYEDADQRDDRFAVIRERRKAKEGQAATSRSNEYKDERPLAERMARKEERPYDPQDELSKKDPTLPATYHGNKPSKGARIDAELKADDEQTLRDKGIK